MTVQTPNDLRAYWMPFTSNRQFKANPRMLSRADGMYYYTPEGRKVLDAVAGLWCVNAGHNRPEIVKAIQDAAAEIDYAPSFQMGHPNAFATANKLISLLPEEYTQVFYTNSGSESVETALKIALAYQRAAGKGTKTRLIGRERGYHGVNFGGISVGGITNNRRMFPTLPGVDHLRATHDLARNAFSRGQPEHGAEFADELERMVMLHGAETIAAVIVEPVAGSAGVLIPPKGYLERLRALCDKHDILLIFDEVITGFGRLGAPFATQFFDVKPDIICTAKALTNATVPMGAVFTRDFIHEAFMHGDEQFIELFHGYTYSGHPLACAAASATMDVLTGEGLLTRAVDAGMAQYWEDALHSLSDHPHVIDVRNLGLVGAVELQPGDKPTQRAYTAFVRAFEKGAYIRFTGDILAFSPPLVAEKAHIDEMIGIVSDVLKEGA